MASIYDTEMQTALTQKLTTITRVGELKAFYADNNIVGRSKIKKVTFKRYWDEAITHVMTGDICNIEVLRYNFAEKERKLDCKIRKEQFKIHVMRENDFIDSFKKIRGDPQQWDYSLPQQYDFIDSIPYDDKYSRFFFHIARLFCHKRVALQFCQTIHILKNMAQEELLKRMGQRRNMIINRKAYNFIGETKNIRIDMFMDVLHTQSIDRLLENQILFGIVQYSRIDTYKRVEAFKHDRKLLMEEIRDPIKLKLTEECPICKEIDNRPAIETKCGHTFHKCCLLTWKEAKMDQWNRQATCPCCRAEL